jgi:2-keto-4-pentenoate hydratase/2-oxohepta-3-ene-1,7-dioic acid hydratase in catechol pathway
MRLVSFLKEGTWCPALRRGDNIVEVADSDLASARAVIAAVAQGRRLTEGLSHPIADVTLGLPVPDPDKIVCIGLNYVDHAKEGGHPIPEYPAVFLRTKSSLVAHGQPLVRPKCSDKFDYEAELAIVIGRPARNVTEADALSHVFGYSCFNDGSLRDYQRRSSQWTMGKNFDGTGPFGPDIVTADELPAGAAGLRIACRLNGQTLQDGNTSDMIFPVARVIALISEVMTLEPGDVIITGTPAGVGYPRKPPVFMRPGDVCEVDIEGIGILRNPVVGA